MGRFLSEQGMSLIEALVSLAIASAAMLALGQMMSSFGGLNKAIKISSDYNTFSSEIYNILKSETQCRQLLLNKLVPPATGTQTPITLTIGGRTYNPADAAGPPYLYGNRASALRVMAISLERSDAAPVAVRYDDNPDPSAITLRNGNRYFVRLNVTVQSDNTVEKVFRKEKQFSLAVITELGTGAIRSCAGEDSAALACERLGGVYDPTLAPSQRCNIAPALSGCIFGGAFSQVGNPSGTNCGADGNRNPATGRCSCPSGFTANRTMNFNGIVDGVTRQIEVFHCYRCDPSSVSSGPSVPYSP